jgi:hypothetical protein
VLFCLLYHEVKGKITGMKRSFFITVLFLTAFSCFFSGASLVSAERSFITPAVNYTVGTNPYSVTSGLFNNDSYIDLVVANSNSANVSILLGVGDGTFSPAVNYEVGNGVYYAISGLFNDDSYVDLAVANDLSYVSILLGIGDGTFSPAVNYDVGNFPYFVATGLFNNDDYVDLAVANYSDDDVSILLGVGDGTFSAAVDYTVGDHPGSIATGLFNNDDYVDLAVTNFIDDDVSILLGVGNGTFSAAVDYGTGEEPCNVISGLFNNDNYLDLATVNSGNSNAVSILLGVGDGTFSPAVNYGAGGTNTYSFASGYVNNDNYLDLVTASGSFDKVSVLLGVGDGTFSAAVDYTVGDRPNSITSGDFNNDNYLDLATANTDSNNVSILLGGLILDYSGNFSEIYSNDGSVLGSREVVLIGDTFVNADDTLTEGVHYTLTNKPDGLTAVMTVDAEGETATLTFTGSATSSTPDDSITDLTITFLDGAFTDTADASEVANYINDEGGITFRDTPVNLYGINGSGSNAVENVNLYVLNPDTGERLATIGPVGYNITGMAFHPDTGVLYAVSGGSGSNSKSLFTINTETGEGTLLGVMKDEGNVSRVFPDISFRSDGRLYGFNPNDVNLYTIDYTSCNGDDDTICLVTKVGDSDGIGNPSGSGLAFDSNDNLYYFGNFEDSFYQINPDTGTIISEINLDPQDVDSIAAAAFDGNDVLYGSRIYNSSNDLVTINTTTGVVTSPGETDDMQYMDAIAFHIVPGCTDPDATNYDSLATDDDGSCILPEPERPRTSSGSSASARAKIVAQNSLLNNIPPTNTPPNTPTNTPPPTPPVFTYPKSLKPGINNEDIKELQHYLNTHGFPVSLTGPGSLGLETNFFGPKTKAAVILFQKAKGLVPDGIVGPKTKAMMGI